VQIGLLNICFLWFWNGKKNINKSLKVETWLTIEKIYLNVLCISESTFYKNLAVNVKKQLRELEIDPDLILVENKLLIELNKF